MIPSYDDIIYRPHPTSTGHRMPLSARAAQFAPFSALTGYSAALAETARLTEQRIELTQDELSELDHRQQILISHINEHPEVTVTWFRPDERKEGGKYITTTGNLKRIDAVQQTMLLLDGTLIPLDDIIHLKNTSFFDLL